MKFARIVISILLLVLVFSDVHAKKGGSRGISLDTFIVETIKNNPTVRQYIQQRSVAVAEEYASRGIDDVNLFSLFNAAKNENSNITGLQPSEEKNLAYQIGATKIVSQSGTRLEASTGYTWLKSTYSPALIAIAGPIPNPLHSPSLTLKLTQPFLRNVLGIQDQLNRRVRGLQRDLEDISYQENVEAFISEMTQLYLNWLRSYQNANSLHNIYVRASRQVNLVREQVAAKVSEESDLYRILETQALYKAEWQGFLADYEGYGRQVAAMMYPDNPPTSIYPRSARGAFIYRILRSGSDIDYLKHSSRLSHILGLSKDVESEVLRANKNAMLPDANVFVSWERKAETNNGSHAWGGGFQLDDVQGGVNLSIPIPNREARGDYRAQKARLKRTMHQNERTMLDAVSSLEALLKQEKRLRERVHSLERQMFYGKKKLDAEEDQYDDGRLSLFQFIQDVNDHIRNEVNLADARAALALVRVQIGELTDQNYDMFQNVIDEVSGNGL